MELAIQQVRSYYMDQAFIFPKNQKRPLWSCAREHRSRVMQRKTDIDTTDPIANETKTLFPEYDHL